MLMLVSMSFENYKKETIRQCKSMHAAMIQPPPDEPLALVGANLRMVPEQYTSRRITGDGLGHPVCCQPGIGPQDRQPASTNIIWVVPLGAHVSTCQVMLVCMDVAALPARVFA
jgi:hypothetical protein